MRRRLLLCCPCLHGDCLLLTHGLVLLKHFERIDESSILLAGGLVDAAGLELLHAGDHAVKSFFGHTSQHLLCLSAERWWLTVGRRAIAGSIGDGRHGGDRPTLLRRGRVNENALTGGGAVKPDGIERGRSRISQRWSGKGGRRCRQRRRRRFLSIAECRMTVGMRRDDDGQRDGKRWTSRG